nr:hypothetical protein [Tanacetum cinerariifolium]
MRTPSQPAQHSNSVQTSSSLGQPGSNPAMTLQDPTTGNWNMDTCASYHLNDSVYSLSDFLICAFIRHGYYLRKCLTDESNVITLDEVQINPESTSHEEPITILESKSRQLRNKEIPLVKVERKHQKDSAGVVYQDTNTSYSTTVYGVLDNTATYTAYYKSKWTDPHRCRVLHGLHLMDTYDDEELGMEIPMDFDVGATASHHDIECMGPDTASSRHLCIQNIFTLSTPQHERIDPTTGEEEAATGKPQVDDPNPVSAASSGDN